MYKQRLQESLQDLGLFTAYLIKRIFSCYRGITVDVARSETVYFRWVLVGHKFATLFKSREAK